jgi:Phospholipase B.
MRNDSILKKDFLISKPKNFHGIHDIPTPMGTIDTKVFFASPFQNVDLYVSSSAFNPYMNNKQNSKPPQNETVEISFQWSNSKFANETHIGIPDMLDFDVIQPKWVWF